MTPWPKGSNSLIKVSQRLRTNPTVAAHCSLSAVFIQNKSERSFFVFQRVKWKILSSVQWLKPSPSPSPFTLTTTPSHGTPLCTVENNNRRLHSLFSVSQNMRFRYPHKTLLPSLSSSKLATMTTQPLFHSSTPFSNSQTHRFRARRALFTVFCSKHVSKQPPPSSPLRTNGYHGTSHASVPRPSKVSPFFLSVVGDRT